MSQHTNKCLGYCLLISCWFEISNGSDFVAKGIPEQADVAPVARPPASAQAAANPPAQTQRPAQPAPAPASGPNANPLDLFPQVGY